jgi:ribosomal protein S18 acetylase RimI-like enzyme
MKDYIRRARTEDAMDRANLAAKTFEETYDDLTRVQVDEYVRQVFSVSLLQRELSDPNVLLLVAVCGEFVGYAQFRPNEVPNGLTGARPIELVQLFRKRGVQRCGIGTGLLEKGFRWAMRQHYDSCWLKVWDQNQDAINFYERKKFRIVGETRYADGGLNDRVLLMEIAISSLE